MEVKTNPGQDSVQVSFKTSGSVSCIKNYNIKICEPGQDCAETKTVQKSDAIDFISETVEGLKQCTDYQVRSPNKLLTCSGVELILEFLCQEVGRTLSFSIFTLNFLKRARV